MSRRPRIDRAALRLRPLIDTGDKAHELVARRIAGSHGARLTVTLFRKIGRAAIWHPDLHRTQSCRAHSLAITRHALRRRCLGLTWHLASYWPAIFVTCYTKLPNVSRATPSLPRNPAS